MAATAEAEVQRITLQARLEHAALECKRLALMAEAEADRVMKMDRADLQGIDMTQLDSASVLSYRCSFVPGLRKINVTICVLFSKGCKRAYLHHLSKCSEILGSRLNTIHNVRFYLRLMEDIRAAIEADRFDIFAAEFYQLQSQGPS